MPLALETIVKQLSDSGIVSSGKLENFIPPKASPKDAEELLRELHKQKLLTKFQAQQVAAGRAKSLILGNYMLLDKIGAGGMGQVFKADHLRLERVVAIKMLPPTLTKDAAAVARFQREVKAAAKLRHPNIVATDDADEANGSHFLVMEYIEGQDLSALVKKSGPLSVEKAVDLVLQAAKGLEYAHKRGIVHRDIKPANLLLDSEGTVKILDMGLARIEAGGNAATQAELTGTGAIMGTVDYMAPEQALDTKHADARADIYSLGCSLYYLLAGGPVYSGETVTSKLLAHQGNAVPTLSALRADIPEAVDDVLAKMLAKKPEDRYQSMTEVIADLQPLVAAGSTMMGSSTLASVDAATSNSNLTFLHNASAGQTVQRKTTKQIKQSKTNGSSGLKNKKLALISATVLGVLILAGIIVSLRTNDGTLIVEVDQPNAMVQVLDAEGKVEISQKGGVGKVTISVDPGKHRLRVEKDGFTVFGKEFEMEKGGTKAITAKLVLLNAARSEQNQAWNTPTFQAWVKSVAALPANDQIKAVWQKLIELNPGFDGEMLGIELQPKPKVENGIVKELGFYGIGVTDISPVRALPSLKALGLSGRGPAKSTVADLTPLQGMQLTYLNCSISQVSDLSPLRGMPLQRLQCQATLVADLAPLNGMRLNYLDVSNTSVSDLSPLKGMRLTTFNCANTNVADLSVLQGMPLVNVYGLGREVSDLSPLADCRSLTLLRIKQAKVTASEIADLQKTLPNCKMEWEDAAKSTSAPTTPAASSTTKLFMHDPAFPKWIKEVQAMPAEEQVQAVSKKLMELNPGFDGKLTRKSDSGMVTELSLHSKSVSDISPVIALVHLKALDCFKTGIADLSPLQGANLSSLSCGDTQVSDLSPLKGMKLTILNCRNTKVSDLSPLQGMMLTSLDCDITPVSSLSPLIAMNLTNLSCGLTKVVDLQPLKGMKLTRLNCGFTSVADLTPLLQCESLANLHVPRTKVTPAAVAALQKALPNCKIEWDDPAKATTPQPAAAGTK